MGSGTQRGARQTSTTPAGAGATQAALAARGRDRWMRSGRTISSRGERGAARRGMQTRRRITVLRGSLQFFVCAT